jgi:Tfp pilus assembly PilM family ATPase
MNLIKNIFLPEKIGANYIFAKRIVAVSIGKTTITATKTYIKGHDITIETIIEEIIETVNAEESDAERITKTLKIVFGKVGSYDELCVIVPSSLVVFKELKLPFLSRERISMVIGFEIEPLLPFSLKDAVIDFIITKQNKEEKSSELLVTAIQKQHIIEYVTFFESINIKPTIITVDTIALYSLYAAIPSYNQLQGGTALIDIGLYTTRITLMINSQLKMIRTLPKGIIAITKKAALDLNITPNEVMEKIIRFGLESTESFEYTQKIEQAIASLWDDINFTFTSFSSQFLNRNAMTKIILLGEGSLIKGLLPSLSKKINIPCELFRVDAIQELKNIHIKNDVVITPVNVVSVSAAIPSPITADYNLLYKEISPPDTTLFIKQAVVSVILTIGLFACLITHYSLQLKKVKNEITISEQQALSALKEKFQNLEDEKKLTDAIDAAHEEIKKQKERWFAFSNQSRASFLQYLLELTSKIDTKTIGLDVEQISMSEQELILKARVKDYEALKILERELGQSQLFSYVEPQENLQFAMKITLAPREEEF